MKKGFTLIEVIFTIVIIGILASVAIPKLVATRDDAEVTKILAQTKTLIKDISSFYTARGQKQYQTAPSQAITNIPISLYSDCHTVGTGSHPFRGSTLYMCVRGNPVLKIGSANRGTTEKFILTAMTSSKIGRILQTNTVFQSFTNGTSSKEYILNNTDVNF